MPSARPTSWPYKAKTRAMQDIEAADLKQRDIRDIILDSIRDNEADALAAEVLDITPSALSHWIARLGIEDAAAEMRERRSRD